MATGSGRGAASSPTGHRSSADRIFRADVRPLSGHKRKVACVNWNKDGSMLASGSADLTTRLWSFDGSSGSMKSVASLHAHTDTVERLVWHPEHPSILATCGSDKTVRLWDSRTASKPTHTIKTPGRNINMTWSGDRIVVGYAGHGSKDDGLSIISFKAASVTTQVKFGYEVNEMSFDNHGYLWLTTGSRGSDEGPVEVFRLTSGGLTRVHRFIPHTSSAFCLSFDPTGDYLATGGADGIVSLFDSKDCACIRTFDRLEWSVRAINFSHDSKYIAAGSEDKFVEISSVKDGRRVRAIKTTDSTNAVAWHPSQHILAFGCDDRNASSDMQGSVQILNAGR